MNQMNPEDIKVGEVYRCLRNGVQVVVDKVEFLDTQFPYVKFHKESTPTQARGLAMVMFCTLYAPALPKAPRLEPKTEFNPKYDHKIIGKDGNNCIVDVYRVLDAFNVTNPMLQHLAKKALNAGQRGHKNMLEDLNDIKTAINAAILFEEQKEQHNA